MKHCQHCDKDFATPSSLKRHNIAKHPENTSALIRHEHRCASCNAKFARYETLQRHKGSKHTLTLMERCQFCLENFRKDYFYRHESSCARKYWAKVCNRASLTNQIQNGQSNEFNGSSVWRNMSSDAQLIPATESSLRVVHEIDIDVRLASEAFDVLFTQFWNTGNVESCLEAITASLRLSVPIKPDPPQFPYLGPFRNLFLLAQDIGEYVRGERDINDADVKLVTIMDRACLTGAADLIEPLVWRGAKLDETTLLSAVQSKNFDTVRFCLTLGADPNDYFWDDDGDNPLTLASAKSETSHIASLLIGYGADVFVRNDEGATPLHLAARRADADLLRVILAKNSSPAFLDATTDEGQRALDAAIESMNSGIAKDQALEFASALLDAGADANGLIYHSALNFGATVRLLLSSEQESHRKTQYLNEALMEAIDKKAKYAFVTLVEAGASVGDEILRHALQHSNSEMVELLLKAGARGDSVGHDTLKFLYGAARDQRKPGTACWRNPRGVNFSWWRNEWVDAMGKCKLLCLYFPDDQLLRRFMNLLEFEVAKFI